MNGLFFKGHKFISSNIVYTHMSESQVGGYNSHVMKSTFLCKIETNKGSYSVHELKSLRID
jgi:hypothetical protein